MAANVLASLARALSADVRKLAWNATWNSPEVGSAHGKVAVGVALQAIGRQSFESLPYACASSNGFNVRTPSPLTSAVLRVTRTRL